MWCNAIIVLSVWQTSWLRIINVSGIMIKLISALMVYAEMEMMRRKEKDAYQCNEWSTKMEGRNSLDY